VQAQIEFDDGDNDTDDEIIVIDESGNEEEIDFPEAMGAYLDSLMTLYMSRTYLSADSGCRTAAENPVFTKEEYIDRLYRMPTIIEMPWNEVVQACIDRYTVRGRRQVSYLLGACNFYMPFFEEALEAYQLPLELKYLPIIESALNPTAVSHAGAAGLWQFIPSSGKMYGLETNTLIDERREPLKSSFAAARLLRDLYNLFGDWHLAIAAYNCGPENVNKAIRRSGGEKDYWKIYSYLPRETRGYVPAFIAANYVMNYYCDHNICPMQTQLPVKTDTVMLDRNVTFSQISSVCGFSIDMLRSLNPQYRRDVVPGATAPSALRLPVGDVTKFIDLQDSVFASTEGAFEKRKEVAVDERVVSKGSKKRGRRGRNTRSTSSSGGSKSVTVRRGDTLGAIAKRNGTTVANLRRLNGIKGNNIRAGKKLRVK
jgi:membrane-bound lytic murein transglycosylase D